MALQALGCCWENEGPAVIVVPVCQVLVSEATALMAYMGRITPDLILQLVVSRLDDNSLAIAAPTPALWKSIVVRLS